MSGPPISEYFILPKDACGKVRAKCKLCTAVISGHTKTTSNFLTHLKRVHPEIIIKPAKCQKEDTQASMQTFIQLKSKYAKADIRQIDLNDATVEFIAGNLLPLSTVESPKFKKLCEKLDPKFQVPSRKYLASKLIVDKANRIQDNLKDQLSKAQNVCLTLDLWSNRQMSAFLGITGHFVSDWELKSVMIACNKFKGKHTSENIGHYYEETLATFNLVDKVLCIVTDNASNMLKTFDMPLPGYSFETVNSEDSSDDEDNEDTDDISDTQEHFDHLSFHLPCYAHTLQLVVRDGIQQTNQHLKNVVLKASQIISHIRKSINASEILESEKRVQAQNVTRWNSQLIMIRSILKIPESKLQEIDYSVKLSAYERKLLKELCEILTPFEDATHLIQQQKHVTASLPIPVTVGLRKKLQSLVSLYNNKIVTTLIESIAKRLSKYEENEALVIATALDPRFKLQWCDQNRSDLENLLKDKVRSLEDTIMDEDDESLSPPKKKAKTDLFSFLDSPATPRKRHHSKMQCKVEDYLSEPLEDMECDPLEFWKARQSTHPHLSKLAWRYFSIQASSAAVERLFSIGGKIFRPDRCRLKFQTFQRLMMIKCNGQ